MTSPDSRNGTASWGILVFYFVAACAFGAFSVANSLSDSTRNKDHSLWYDVGVAVRSGAPLYQIGADGELEYMYPPALAVLLFAPLSCLGPAGLTATLCLLNALSWSICIWASTLLITGRFQGHSIWLYLAPSLAIAPYVWDIQLLGQSNLMLLALTLCSFVAMRNQRLYRCGILFGAAVAMKVFPLPAIAYLIVRRKWMSIAAAIGTVVAMNLVIPGTIRGFDRTIGELKQWSEMMVADQSGETVAARSSIGFTRRNQSLISVTHRWLRHVDAGDDTHKPLYIYVTNVSPTTAQAVGYTLGLFLGFLLVISCRFQLAPNRACEGLEMAMVCVLVPLCSPLAWTYYFCWLLVGWTAVAYWVWDTTLPLTKRRIAGWTANIAGLLLASAVTEQFDPTLQAYGVTALGAIVLFLSIAYLRFHMPTSNPLPTSCESLQA